MSETKDEVEELKKEQEELRGEIQKEVDHRDEVLAKHEEGYEKEKQRIIDEYHKVYDPLSDRQNKIYYRQQELKTNKQRLLELTERAYLALIQSGLKDADIGNDSDALLNLAKEKAQRLFDDEVPSA